MRPKGWFRPGNRSSSDPGRNLEGAHGRTKHGGEARFQAVLAPPAALAQSTAISGKKVTVRGGSYTNVGPATLKEMLAKKDFFFANVHVPYEGEIARTDANIPYDQVEQKIDRFPSDRNAPILLYCRSGRMSTTAAETLVRLGYTNVWHLEGGFIAWERAGFPLIRR